MEVKPEPEMVSLVAPNREPTLGDTLVTSRRYSTLTFTPALHDTEHVFTHSFH